MAEHSEKEKELAKFEMFAQDVPRGLKPGNPYREGNEYGKAGARFPMMLYKPQRQPNGKWAVSMSRPAYFGFISQDDWLRACEFADNFTTSCQRIVHNEQERQAARDSGEGWRDTAEEALALGAAWDKAAGDAAAEGNFQDRNMSEKARAEKDAIVAQNFGHLAEIPEQPRARRGSAPRTNQPQTS